MILNLNSDPVITYVSQTGPNNARLAWNFTNSNIFQRYRIQLSSDTFVNDIIEWPGN